MSLRTAVCCVLWFSASAPALAASRKAKPKAEATSTPAAAEPAPAVPQGSEARRFLDAARALFDDLEYERALEQLERAKKVPATISESVELNLLEGVVLAELQRSGPSDAAFRSALVLEPKAALPVQVSPRVALQFEAVRAQVLASKREPTPVVAPGPSEPTSVAEAPSEEPGRSGVGLTLGLRGDVDVLGPGASPALSFSFVPGTFGVAAAVFPKANPGFRLEGRVSPLDGTVRPYLGVGATAFTRSVGPRAAVGTELAFGKVRLFVDAAFEKHFALGAGTASPTVLLVGGGAGMGF